MPFKPPAGQISALVARYTVASFDAARVRTYDRRMSQLPDLAPFRDGRFTWRDIALAGAILISLAAFVRPLLPDASDEPASEPTPDAGSSGTDTDA